MTPEVPGAEVPRSGAGDEVPGGVDESEVEGRPEPHVLAAAHDWRDQDPDPQTRAELDELLTRTEQGDADAASDLRARFGARLVFGTAGLRGELGAGPTRMNRVLVGQAAAGFAAFLLERESHPSVVIGFDGRRNSDVFARDTAEIMAGAGVRAILLPRMLPTPVLAFAVRHLGASGGVMVTASHNPPGDNGYKVYLGGESAGSQIVSPADAEIESHIARIAAGVRFGDLPRSADFETADEAVVEEYIARTVALAPLNPQPLRYVYTPLHGVGLEVANRVFAEAGFAAPIVVEEQAHPDGGFPTVAFPNPEEPGAMDLAYATATAANADLIIANDPDADRCAVAIPDPTSPDGWRRLSGNQVGAMLGWRAAERARASGAKVSFASTVVSSPALRRIADEYGLRHEETLTGFKWVSRVEHLAYGYEEALGYLVDPEKVRDKDGISAALDVLGLFSDLRAAGKTFADHEREFTERFGAFISSQVSLRVTDIAVIDRLMTSLRAAPPAEIADLAVTAVVDFAVGVDNFPPSDIIRFDLDGGARVIVRPSGTEPKLKAYIDASSSDGDAAERQSRAQATVDRLQSAMEALIESRAQTLP